MWEIREDYDPDERGRYGMRDDDAEEAYMEGYEKGCEHGYRKAMKEAQKERDYEKMGMRNDYPTYHGGSNKRVFYRDDMDDMDDMDERMGYRRRRDSRGRYM